MIARLISQLTSQKHFNFLIRHFHKNTFELYLRVYMPRDPKYPEIKGRWLFFFDFQGGKIILFLTSQLEKAYAYL